MKKHLFYTFLFLFIATAIITLGGITKLIQIDEFYLKGLFASLILELCGAVIFMYQKTDFFDVFEERVINIPSVNDSKPVDVSIKSDLMNKTSYLENGKPSTITVEEVIKAINSAPPFQKEEVSEKYIGLIFEQVGYLRQINTDWNDKSKVSVNIVLRKEDIVGYSVWFSISLEEIPEIKVLQKDAIIKVKGKLIRASGEGLCITLQPTDIEVIGEYEQSVQADLI